MLSFSFLLAQGFSLRRLFMGNFRAKAEIWCLCLRNKQGVKHSNPFRCSTTAEGTNTAFQEDGLHLPREPLQPKLARILCSLSDVEVSNTMLFYFTFSWGVGCTNHTPCVHLAVSSMSASGYGGCKTLSSLIKP